MDGAQLVEKLQSLIRMKAQKEAERDQLVKEITDLENMLVESYGSDWPTTLKNTAAYIENFGI